MPTVEDVHQDNGAEWYEQAENGLDCCLLTLATYGKCIYWVNGERHIMERGDVLLIPAHTPYYGKSVPTLVHTKTVVGFTVSAEDAGALPLLRCGHPYKRRLGRYESVHDRIRVLREQWIDRPSYYELMAQSILMELLIDISREYDRGQIRTEKYRHVDHMKRYIERNYREKITKEELGEVIGRTPNYAASLFKEVTGRTISECVHRQRMKRAVYMLEESTLNAAEIAEFLGYKDVSYFYRIFKKITGGSPSALLKDRRTGANA
ncbi:AraC family transcriptional regulator [Saccharibacillus sp. CPCC 101409]|uniref:helix-turn-helix domain-containing protein n=1 Tax=Saccharibacillus sp. CPCC 101409 TaxID=3058041 RepID=UPI00267335E4|nr:AraC family transcriptional regulator [Saccharibacillus sp. CPCC 101409]MDO3411637.1 AraC family transcriptional regulator [Saccharibacillus sp. CPCC 101409]